ncbi:COG4315 family predicted lipoprotein [Amycolatopsis magusensis]|uniref:Lipoprotein with Yx(FWY)xxD motif n=1 Tax=Amycolatopsis magusensis TaxID=882444 RepID=A0ABS4PNB1_9PSEU|nr:hypothetical protein [Amycolatopsis magusensis]MBP2180892.1 putative lipoprotein with Yx(FWY)xxD motif [Amycolatopsis magusensis]MDI5975960.1 hypothetical protein [Amycolatopsis magusensis]
MSARHGAGQRPRGSGSWRAARRGAGGLRRATVLWLRDLGELGRRAGLATTVGKVAMGAVGALLVVGALNWWGADSEDVPQPVASETLETSEALVKPPELASDDPSAPDMAQLDEGVQAPETDAEETMPLPPAGSGKAVKLVARDVPSMGETVTDGSGAVLYRFERDRTGPPKSLCEGDCAKTWPPVLTERQATVEGVAPELVGTVRRADGSWQVTLAGRPLYRFAGDRTAGDWSGHGRDGQWFAVRPDGERNQRAAAAGG